MNGHRLIPPRTKLPNGDGGRCCGRLAQGRFWRIRAGMTEVVRCCG
ncbi:hypothetical protein XHC_1475 [Xanthomonas hortorum pv. carotae str. M081]|nr:hypothetical protein XHC_1475 [Xanthomonas hortorum pv. carotae str. M081]